MRYFFLLLLTLVPITGLTKLHFATPYSERVYISQTTKEFSQELSHSIKRSVVFHSGESLYKHNEIYRAVRTNQIQLGEIFIAQMSNHSAIYQLDNLPFIATTFKQAKTLWQYQQQELKRQLAKHELHLLFANPWPPQGLFTSKAIHSVDDLTGLKVRSYSSITAKLANHLSMIPTSIATSEIAQAFATGMIDAMITSPATGVSSRAWQFSSHYTPINAWIPKNMVVMNHSAYSSLSADEKTTLKQLNAKYQTIAWQRAKKQTDLMTKQLEKQGMVIAPVSQSLANSLKLSGDAMAKSWALHATTQEYKVLVEFQAHQHAL